MTAVPETRYARSGDVSSAYQVLGDGPSTSCSCPASSRRWYATRLRLGGRPALPEEQMLYAVTSTGEGA